MTQNQENLLTKTLEALSAVESHALRLALLNEMSTELNLATTFEEICRTIAEKTSLLLNSNWVGLALLNEPQQKFNLFVLNDFEVVLLPEQELLPEGTLVYQALQENRLLILADISELTARDLELARQQNIRSMTIIPLTARGQGVGALMVGSEELSAYTSSDESFMFQLASLVASSLDNQHLLLQTQTTLARTRALYNISRCLLTFESLIDVLQAIVDGVVEALSAHRAVLITFDLDKRKMVHFVKGGPGKKYLTLTSFDELWHGLSGWVLRNLEPAFSPKNTLDPREGPEVQQRRLDNDGGSIIVVPLHYRDKVLGTITAINNMAQPDFSPDDIELMVAMAGQAAMALEQQRLFEQSRQRAAELEMIFQALPDSYFRLEMNGTILDYQAGRLPSRVGEHSPLIKEGTLIGHTIGEVFSAEVSQRIEAAVAQVAETRSSVNVEYALFSPKGEENYETWLVPLLEDQVIMTLRNITKRKQAELMLAKRANQLQWLTVLEANLSQATNEAEILTAVALGLNFSHPTCVGWLQYIEVDERYHPLTVQTVAIWQKGYVWQDAPEINEVEVVAELPLTKLWLQHENEAVFITDLPHDPRLEDDERSQLLEAGYQAIALLPLRSGNRWQAIITFTWQEAYNFSADNHFYLEHLLEPLAAVIASRRASLAQQEALALTETLYQTSRHIHGSADLAEVLVVLAEVVAKPTMNRGLIVVYERDPFGQVQMATVVANWHSGAGYPPVPVGTHYSHEDLAILRFIVNPAPLFFEDVRHKITDPTWSTRFEERCIRAVAALPLWIGSRHLGVLLFYAEEKHVFTEREIQLYFSLAPQVAVALENKQLLEQARARARREQVLRELTARVRGVTDIENIMQTAVREVGQALGRKTFIKVGSGIRG